MEQMMRVTADDSPAIVYQSRIRFVRLLTFLLLAALAACAAVLAAVSPAVRVGLGALSAVFIALAFKRRRVELDITADAVRERNQYALIARTRRTKLSDYGSISIAVHANDNEAHEGEFMSSYEVYILGIGQAPVLLYATGDRLLAEKEVELLSSRLNWVVGWHSRAYGV